MIGRAESPAAPRWGFGGWLVVAAAFAIGYVNFPRQVLGPRFEYLPGDFADNRINNYILEHGYRSLTGRDESFWDAPMFYPAPQTTAFSDAHIGMLPLYAAMRGGGLSPEESFQGHFLACFVLNYAATVWALRRLGAGPFGAAAGAYVFAFGLPLAAQLRHTQLFPRFLVPLAVVFAWEFLRAPRAWRLALVAGCWAAQMYLTVYIGYFLALLLAVGGLVAVVRFGRVLPWCALLVPGWREWFWRFAALATAALAVWPLVAHHANQVQTVSLDFLRATGPRPAAWLTPPSTTRMYPELVEWTRPDPAAGDVGEQAMCPGLVPLAAVGLGGLVACLPGAGRRRASVAVAAITALLIGLALTQFGNTWLYEWITRLPGTAGIRVPGRMVLVLLFPAAVVVAGGVDLVVRLARRGGWFPAALAGVLAFGVVAADQWLSRADGPKSSEWEWNRYALETILARQARIVDAARDQPEAKLLYVFPSAGNGPGDAMGLQLEAMRAAQELGIPCVNGWSGYLPPGWSFFPNYRELMAWLTARNAPPDRVAGLVLVGEPTPDADPAYDAALRAKYPPRRLP